ncbi:spermidine synthase [Paenibacillus cellulosilyticus]|uniref:Polyamine aminopropyltransferase n=1 Tax=Paenibacillus cellulosilyticus TaxID=375489 RepID=A0A2V2YZY0_9BACL|nr:polyamine aminopropyltransferase [Paenibacillus cellulosilyticus]PWW08583.1 spermidine synthase [Paenibacillus cellulosilyticus]QKS48154.1 polyamine aminopropyltransferase [Paenibacillus cellulosilyticus]
MTNRKPSLTGFQKESNGELWLWDDLPQLHMEAGYKVEALLHYERSAYQEISIVETKGFGRMFVLDGTPQVTTKDGFVYNEMITHIPMVTHPAPRRIAMIGGGDCGPASVAMKYDTVEQVEVVEIDERVIEVCKVWMPNAAAVASDNRVQMTYADGYRWIQGRKKAFDVLLIDRSDPYGPAVSLYKPAFYQYVHDSLTNDGVVVIQSGSPCYNGNSLRNTVRSLKRIFPIVRTYLCCIPSFPGGIWSFTLASKQYDPLIADLSRLRTEDAKYMTPELLRSCFVLPRYVQDLLSE